MREVRLSTTIRRAATGDAARLTAIAHAAKSHWDYPQTWIRSWSEQLTVTEDYVAAQRVFLIEERGETLGFYALSGRGATLELDHLWIDPSGMGRGLGRDLLEHACAEARHAGARAIEIDSDPYAEGFYERMGARRIGKTPAPMDEAPDRYLPRMALPLDD